MHLIGNMLYLWIFGDNVEDSMGTVKFIIFYLLCGTIAALCQGLVDPESQIPMVGASGAIAGVLGAYLMLFPKANVKCLVFIIIIIQMIRVPAFLVLGFCLCWCLVFVGCFGFCLFLVRSKLLLPHFISFSYCFHIVFDTEIGWLGIPMHHGLMSTGREPGVDRRQEQEHEGSARRHVRRAEAVLALSRESLYPCLSLRTKYLALRAP